jgi:hypothetical protein
LKLLFEKDIRLPENVSDILHKNSNFINFNTTQEIIDVVTGDPETSTFEVKYDVPGKGEYVEAVVNRIKNGVAANYTEAYMRRRDPDTMVIVDELPTDKKHLSVL